MEEGTSNSPSDICSTGKDDNVLPGKDDSVLPGKDYDVLQWDAREECEVRQILDRIADKWSLLVIALLEKRTLRFTELKRNIDGISQRMLTTTLRHLERDGIIERTVYPVVPPKVDYALTPLGCTLHETIRSLVLWTEQNQTDIIAARQRYDARGGSDSL